MSEHHHNQQALMVATMPALLPAGMVCKGAHIGMMVRPAADVLLLPAELIRKSDAGEVEVFLARPSASDAGVHEGTDIAADGTSAVPAALAEAWDPVPDGMQLHVLGEPLPTSKVMVIFMLNTGVVDTLESRIVAPGGRQERQTESVVAHAVLNITPLDRFQEAHVNNLRGPTT